MSVLGNIVRQNKKEAGGGAGGLTAANNGTSVSGTTVQLGNDAGLATAILLNDREIPMGGFSFLMHSGGNDQLLIDPAGSYKIGDIDNFLGFNTFLDIDAVNAVISSYIIDGFGSIGKFSTSNSSSFISQEDGTFAYSCRTQNNNASITSNEALNGRAQVNAMHDGTNPFARMMSENEAPVTDFLNFNVYRDQIKANGGVGGVTAIPLLLDLANNIYSIGDTTAYNNGTFLQIDDAAQTVVIPNGFTGDEYFRANTSGSGYSFLIGGDADYTLAECEVFLYGDHANLYAQDGAGNSAEISVNGTGSILFVNAVNGIEITGGGATTGGIKTKQPSATGAGLWLLGKKVAAAVAFDATQYVEAMIDGVVYKLALAT